MYKILGKITIVKDEIIDAVTAYVIATCPYCGKMLDEQTSSYKFKNAPQSMTIMCANGGVHHLYSEADGRIRRQVNMQARQYEPAADFFEVINYSPLRVLANRINKLEDDSESR